MHYRLTRCVIVGVVAIGCVVGIRSMFTLDWYSFGDAVPPILARTLSASDIAIENLSIDHVSIATKSHLVLKQDREVELNLVAELPLHGKRFNIPQKKSDKSAWRKTIDFQSSKGVKELMKRSELALRIRFESRSSCDAGYSIEATQIAFVSSQDRGRIDCKIRLRPPKREGTYRVVIDAVEYNRVETMRKPMRESEMLSLQVLVRH